MIFPPEPIRKLRKSVAAKAHAGEISHEEGFRRVLREDPEDAYALLYLGEEAELAGDLTEGERLIRLAIRYHPNGYKGYMLLSRILGTRDSLGRGYAVLGVSKMRYDDAAFQDFDTSAIEERIGGSGALEGLSSEQICAALLASLKRAQQQEPDPPEVEDELRPHRLIHELREHTDDVLDTTTVNAILEHGAKCEPLLMGILKEYGEDQLVAEDYSMVERALALLGEIGNPEVLPAITEFLTLPDEEDLQGPADWAFRRISLRRPVETLDKIREILLTASATGLERMVLGQQISRMPKVPGRSEVLSATLDGVDSLPQQQREAMILSTITSFYTVEGGKSFQAAALERKYAASFSGEARSDLRSLRREVEFDEPAEATPSELSVYDICCTEPDLTEDDRDDVPTPVKAVAKPGRNEPCWCGSGKKYKKCHLPQDEAESGAGR